MSLMPPNSAALLISLTRISAIELKDGKSSTRGPAVRGPMLLIPSMLIDSIDGFEPATEIPPLGSVCTPGCAVRVDIALVDPEPRVAMATGKSTSSRLPFVSAMLDTSVSITGAASAITLTVCVWEATDVYLKYFSYQRIERSVQSTTCLGS